MLFYKMNPKTDEKIHQLADQFFKLFKNKITIHINIIISQNVSFVLIWSLALIIVFARTKRNASERFFSCNNWYMFLFRVLIFIVIPLIWFFSNLLYAIGVVLQLYNNTYAETTLQNCAKKCHLAKGITSGEFIDFCCLGNP